MSTRGFISFVANGEAKHAFSATDSMPYGLGITVLHWLRRARRDPDTLRRAITNVKLIDGSQLPTEADVARFQAYADPGVGDPKTSWYALLRFTQGDPATILDCGYIVDEGEPYGWVYEVNCDDHTLSVDMDGDNGQRLTWPWSELPSDHEFLEVERRLDPDYFW